MTKQATAACCENEAWKHAPILAGYFIPALDRESIEASFLTLCTKPVEFPLEVLDRFNTDHEKAGLYVSVRGEPRHGELPELQIIYPPSFGNGDTDVIVSWVTAYFSTQMPDVSMFAIGHKHTQDVFEDGQSQFIDWHLSPSVFP